MTTAPTAEQIKAAYTRGVVLQNQGKFADAEKIFRAILQQRELAEPAFQLGRIAARTGKRAEAVTWFQRALKVKPRQPEIWAEMIGALEPADRPRAVAEARKLGVALTDKAASDLRQAAEHIKAGRMTQARKLYRAAIKDGADEAMVLTEWANQLNDHEHPEEALEIYDEVLSRFPDHARPRLAKASALQTLGRLEESQAELRLALKTAPYNASGWNALMRLNKQEPGSADVDLLEKRLHEGVADPEAVRGMSFALAKGLEDQKEYGRVFEHLNRANRMTRAKYPWDLSSDLSKVSAAIKGWTPLSGGYEDYAPIFVTGLPRSGTTLVETILGSHAVVVAGGEMGIVTNLFKGTLDRYLEEGIPYDQRKVGSDYEKEARRRAETPDPAIRITDKSITTYAFIGHVLNAMPKARFVVLDRDRRDVGLSIYKNRFRDGSHRYSNDLSDVARQIRIFDAAVAAWQKRVPEVIHLVDYDALTAEPEPHIRALLEFCGLDWDPACLTPERTERNVKTLSAVQVRQPIYRSSVAAWTRFEDDLKPLIETLEATKYDFG